MSVGRVLGQLKRLACCGWLLFPSVDLVYADQAVSMEANLTWIYQNPNASALTSSNTFSGDVGLQYQREKTAYFAHIEGCSTPVQTSAAHLLPQSNSDAGSALDHRNQGRIQLSELFMTWQYSPQTEWSFGLIDATAYMDSGVISNDENTQFISAPLVNNPIIDFPDYTLGAVVKRDYGNYLVSRLLLSSSHGLADNPRRNYSQAFEIGQDDKGLFIDVEAGFETEKQSVALGGWMHTAPHQSLSDVNQTNLHNYGFYLNAYQNFGKHGFEGRLAYANPEVSSGELFASLTYQYQHTDWTFGSGYSWTKTSNRITDPLYRHDSQLLEIYLRYPLQHSFELTPSLQFFEQPDYNHDEVQLDDFLWSANLRFSYAF